MHRDKIRLARRFRSAAGRDDSRDETGRTSHGLGRRRRNIGWRGDIRQPLCRRHARRDILPRLVAAIRPLDPTPEELDGIFESLRQARAPIAEVLRPREITNALMDRWE